MTRQSQAIAYAGLLLAVYAILWFNLLPIPLVSPEIRAQIVPCLPFNFLVTLGSYCLWELGVGILTFGECEEAHDELMKDIGVAREFLLGKGVSID